ncbi:structure-specific endonuclease subunit SLX1 [Cuculus canorus]|uniref:structure-specific endonuclease subunit SLX1 n=1 Tax=Cuculus canorus TaxID=55661 RepID=UPI0023AA5431|nr:structure-specific endonuclease subunit SLX1 [Cuculus canorus]
MLCVYLLRSLANSGRCYVGFSVSPERRLRQHNGGRARGGARATARGGPWALELFVYGFPNAIAALRFEWAWQHPGRSRRLRGWWERGRSERGALGRALRTLPLLLRAPPWCRLPLRLRWFREKPLPPLSPAPPGHVIVEQGKEGLREEEEEEEEEEVPPRRESCDLCGEGYEVSWPPLRCCRCPTAAHPPCLARALLPPHSPQLLPLRGACPGCGAPLLWGDLIRRHRKAHGPSPAST